MISRRRFLSGAAVAAAVCGTRKARAAAKAFTPAGADVASGGVAQFVNIKIGTGGHGHTYPGASVPFGMVQLSPDTYTQGWDWCAGYHASDTSIMGFSHTHLSGTGIGDMLDILLMPRRGEVKIVPGSRENPDEGYRSRFSHDDEVTVPGYYSVLLRDTGIHAELSATARAGIHRYRFPADPTSHIVFDFHHGYADGPNTVRWAKLNVIGKDTITGGRSTARWANGREIYFAMKFSRPFESIDVFAEGAKLDTLPAEIDGKSLKCVLHYPTKADEVILVKTAISGVSVEGALRNLEAEIPAWDFDQVRAQARQQWEEQLGKIKVEGGTPKQKEIFYTAFYHTLLAPTLFDDVDGSYRGMDGEVHQLAAGMHNYSTYSLWDTYRALHPLFTLTQPARVPDFVNCLIRMAHESPVGMPVWPLQAKETKCMTGYHSAGVIAEAVQKGFPGIDVAAAWSAMKKEATVSDYRGLPLYRQYGYIPCDLDSESIGKSMDYAYNDWAVAHIAKLAGDEQEAQALLKQAHNYRNLYDKGTGFVRPRLQNGEWAEPFAPNEIGHSKKWRDFTESNAWQATFAVQHDPEGLASLMGGPDKLQEKLDGIFNASSVQPPDAPDDIAGLVGQYAHGNEPSHHIAYLYIYAGAPHKTQERVWSLMETMYNNDPDGLAGNEDCGQMSAWYVMSAMGIYAVDPVSANYVFGTPLFDRVTIETGHGSRLVIEAKRHSASDKYIDAVRLNGQRHKQLWFRHADIAKGGRIELAMSATPNLQLGAAPEDAPPSMSSAG
jgi:predicted alpha-1,2-mannosidase